MSFLYHLINKAETISIILAYFGCISHCYHNTGKIRFGYNSDIVNFLLEWIYCQVNLECI
jgi:hypothetical protein